MTLSCRVWRHYQGKLDWRAPLSAATDKLNEKQTSVDIDQCERDRHTPLLGIELPSIKDFTLSKTNCVSSLMFRMHTHTHFILLAWTKLCLFVKQENKRHWPFLEKGKSTINQCFLWKKWANVQEKWVLVWRCSFNGRRSAKNPCRRFVSLDRGDRVETFIESVMGRRSREWDSVHSWDVCQLQSPKTGEGGVCPKANCPSFS